MSRFGVVSLIAGVVTVILCALGQWIGAVITLFALCLFTAVAVCSMRSGIFGPALTCKKGSPNLYLTFDDGPDPELTPRVLDLLQQNGITATFFLIARKAEQHPELVSLNPNQLFFHRNHCLTVLSVHYYMQRFVERHVPDILTLINYRTVF